jgi:hypothetical protein
MCELRIAQAIAISFGTLVGDARIEHPEQNVNHFKLRDMDRTQVPVGGLALCFGATVETEARRVLLEPFRHSNG